MEWDHQRIISVLLSKPNINIFDEFLKEIETYFCRAVTTVGEMKDRDSKKKKGDVWEIFCRDWLIASGRYVNVWLLKDFNPQAPQQDNGIDLIAQTTTGWVAIQCKYRNKAKYVDWKSLSTFVGLCARSGPWEVHLVMSNCTGISHKLPRTPKDRSICRKTFQNTTREHWLKMTGNYQPRRLDEPVQIQITNLNGTISQTTLSSSTPATLEELRQARLARFAPN